jgi:hypothetical protein
LRNSGSSGRLIVSTGLPGKLWIGFIRRNAAVVIILTLVGASTASRKLGHDPILFVSFVGVH